MPIRVLIADDHPILRDGVRRLLAGEPDMRVVGEVEDGREVVDRAVEVSPDVVLLDFAMPGLDGPAIARRLRAAVPRARALVFTVRLDAACVRRALRAGAVGYLTKDASARELIGAVRTVAAGESYLSPAVAGLMADERSRRSRTGATGLDLLTNREREVLKLIAEGHTSRGIAGIVRIPIRTVELYKRRLKRKLSIRSRAGLVRFSIAERVIELGPATAAAKGTREKPA